MVTPTTAQAGGERFVPYYSDRTMRMFELFFRPWRERRLLTRILDAPGSIHDDAPLVFVANHTSWWDGFLLRDLQRTMRAGRPLYSVMTAHELQKNPFLRRIGAVPLEPHSPGSMLALLRALQGAAAAQPGVCISFFPQGRITPAWQRPLGFRRGVQLLLRALQPCWVVPVGIHIEPLNRTMPTAFVSAGAPVRATGDVTASNLENAVRERLDRIATRLVNNAEMHDARERA